MSTAVDYMPGETLWNEYQTFIDKTATGIARSFWTVEAEDVKQEIWVWLWQSESTLLANGKSASYIRTCIRNVSRNYALKMRDTTLLQTDRFYYTFDEVRELLPAFFSTYDMWAMVPVPQGCETTTRNDAVEMMVDLALAYSKLSEAQQEVLARRYGDDEELTEQKDRQQASRALKKLVLTLNAETDKRAKAHTGPGSRKAITNAAAQVKAAGDYVD